jgi:hypothetical protein
MSEIGTLELIGRELARATEPLTDRLAGGDARRFLNMLGLDVPLSSIDPDLEAAMSSTAAAAQVLRELIPELIAAIEAEQIGTIVAKAVEIVEQVRAVVEAVEIIVSALGSISIPGITPAQVLSFIGDAGERVADLVLVEHLQGYYPLIFNVLRFFGVVEIQRKNVGQPNLQLTEYEEKRFRFDRIGQLLSDPGTLVHEVYGWGENDFDTAALIDRLAALFAGLGAPVSRVMVDGRPRLEISLLSLTATQGVNPPGLDAQIIQTITEGLSASVPVADGMALDFSAEATLQASAGLSLRPPADLIIIPPSGSARGAAGVGFSITPVAPAEALTLIGLTAGTGLYFGRLHAGVTAGFDWEGSQARGDIGFEARLEEGKLKISAAGADGFLGELLAGIALEADFDVGVSWTAGTGLRFTGSHSLSIQLPSHIDLGPIQLDALTLTLGIDGDEFPISLSTNIVAQLGPLTASVEQIGGTIILSFPGRGGNAGPVNITGAFKPPVGAGLALDAGPVSGGGYLYFDYENGDYAGALELDLAGIVAVRAVGLIATKMPDGSDGFSLLIVITAEFGTGIQLGFGFTLLGVGGILGLNRSMSLEALAEGVRAGTLDSVMFPTDVIANAQRIISDLKSFFPVEVDTFVIGPLAKLGWGTPTLVTLSLGVVIEIPPGNIAILGVLKVVLPDEDAALLVLQVSFIGAIEFDKSRAWFFASLFGSRVLFMTLEGEMGVLVAWGDEPNFVISVGGFFPGFQPPPLPFPTPRRIAVSILNESWGRIRVEGSFAVTSNTAQFGAALDIYFGFSAFSINGYLSLDALFQFSPFYMIVQISGRLSLSVAGMDLLSVRLSFTLEGPSRWRARGSGSVRVLFFEISADFDESWGESVDTTLPSISALPILAAEFRKLSNWVAELPAASSLAITLRELEETEALVLHPLGTLRIAQRAIPLEIDIAKVGNQDVNDAHRFTVESASTLFDRLGETRDSFASAQFLKLSDAERLSRKGYESQPSGVSLGAAEAELRAVRAVTRTIRYELSVIDSSHRPRLTRFFGLALRLFALFLNGNAVSLSPMSQATKKKLNPYDDRVKVAPGAYAVVDAASNVAAGPGQMSFVSEAQARAYVADVKATQGRNAPGLAVVEAHEARLAA